MLHQIVDLNQCGQEIPLVKNGHRFDVSFFYCLWKQKTLQRHNYESLDVITKLRHSYKKRRHRHSSCMVCKDFNSQAILKIIIETAMLDDWFLICKIVMWPCNMLVQIIP